MALGIAPPALKHRPPRRRPWLLERRDPLGKWLAWGNYASKENAERALYRQGWVGDLDLFRIRHREAK